MQALAAPCRGGRGAGAGPAVADDLDPDVPDGDGIPTGGRPAVAAWRSVFDAHSVGQTA